MGKRKSNTPLIHTPSLTTGLDPLSDRQREILRLIIQQYVLTANPVGSRYLARISSLGLSDASTRNIMSDLEFLGFIDHPHTSAGRMPTDKGYRVYVNELMALEKLSEAERKAVSRSLVDALSAEDIIRESTEILAKLSKQLSLVLLPALEEGMLERVEIVPLSSSRVLIVLIASSGRVRTVTLETETQIDHSKIEELRSVLNERLSGRSFKEIRATFTERVKDLPEHAKDVLRVFLDSPDRLIDDPDRVKLSGAKHIFSQPEFQKKNIISDDEFQSIIELLDNEDVVIHVLERASGNQSSLSPATEPVAIRIGSELEDEKMTNYSVISTRYKIGDQQGVIGLIGPKRMNYARMAPLVEYVARAMTNALTSK
ncbi:MAG TPA: heat-inducible transcriptional repressor HrcA [Candidatus Kapabacteria bacterium]|nr:heat-inducible transcriptional repressor HrcA [Candidatus Kapabacteria bacterium]